MPNHLSFYLVIRFTSFQLAYIRTMKKQLFILFIGLFCIASLSIAQTEQAEQNIQDLISKTGAVGISVAVVKHNKIVYAHSFGWQNLEKKQALSNAHLFRIASISKSFTATAIMQLVEAKKLSLDDDFGELVGFKVRNPAFPDTKITLRMVLSHTSSINDSEGYFSLDGINPNKNPNWAKCYNNYEPGKGYAYCNLNYNMTGAVLEKVSGERFDQYIKKNILDPLGLYGGYCVDSLDKSRLATLYDYNKETDQFIAADAAYDPRSELIKNHILGVTTPIFSPTGGMKITATDLAKYMTMHANYGKYMETRIISKKSAKMMQSKIAKEAGYGLALETTDQLIPGEIMCGHTGSAYGLYSGMFFQHKKKFGIVVICNGVKANFDSGMNSVTKNAINILYDAFLKQ